ncbi:MAG: hypothetical protein JJ863_03235 [Deltaproteobacteria bacterium]|nr:hypothetical protein [Deltaproteobacteria bacterium]
MGYRDELEALRINHEIVSKELETMRAKATASVEHAARLERNLALAEGRVGELEDLLGGELGQRALRRRWLRRASTAIAVLAVAAMGLMMKTEVEKARVTAELTAAQSVERAARTAACEAELERERAKAEILETQYQGFYERFMDGMGHPVR